MDKKEVIKQTIKSPGWEHIKEMMYEEIINKPIDIKSKGKTNEEISREVVAQELAVQRLNRFLNKVNAIVGEKKDKNVFR